MTWTASSKIFLPVANNSAKVTRDMMPWQQGKHVLRERHVDHRVRVEDHDEDETADHRSQLNCTRHAKEIPVEISQTADSARSYLDQSPTRNWARNQETRQRFSGVGHSRVPPSPHTSNKHEYCECAKDNDCSDVQLSESLQIQTKRQNRE